MDDEPYFCRPFQKVIMSAKRTYEIAFVGLKPGIHEYLYEITDKFFADRGVQDFTDCNAEVRLQLEKNTGFMRLHFEVGGSLKIVCDRCGNDLPIQLWEDFNMLVKLVEDPEQMNDTEEDPDVFYISHTESHLRLEDWIHEFINLSIPMQRMCSDEQIGGPFCNKEVLQRLNQMRPAEDAEGTNKGNLWKGLEQFKDLPEE